MKKIFFLFISLLLFFVITGATWYYSRFKQVKVDAAVSLKDSAKIKKLNTHIVTSRSYVASHGFNTRTAFFIDMSLESGNSRFFIVDLQHDSIQTSALVTHGRCNEDWLKGRKYSNKIGSGCTSLGRYKIGKPYNGRFGLAYKLHGLDASNGNAYNRFVVLHSLQCVPDKETHPFPLCQSDGCPAVSPAFLKKLQQIIDVSPTPVLLWIYE